MADWVTFLHPFLELSNYPVLQDKGKVSALEAKLKAEGNTRFTASARTWNISRTSTARSNASKAGNPELPPKIVGENARARVHSAAAPQSMQRRT